MALGEQDAKHLIDRLLDAINKVAKESAEWKELILAGSGTVSKIRAMDKKFFTGLQKLEEIENKLDQALSLLHILARQDPPQPKPAREEPKKP